MIRVIVTYQATDITYLEVSGHARSAEYGKDIVCAGVSSLVLSNLMYAQKHQLGKFESQQEDGHVVVQVQETNAELQHLLAAIVEGLTLIQEQYPQYIEIERRR